MTNELSNIYQRHVKMVYRICFTYMKNSHDTEDAVADTFVKALKNPPAFKSEEHEKAWLIRAAGSVCKDSLKGRWRQHEDLSDYADSLQAAPAFETDDVSEAVMELPQRYRLVIYLYYYEGYNCKQIAGMLRKPHSTIRNYLHEAREILRKVLGEDYER